IGLVFDVLVPTLTVERNVEIPLLAAPLSRYERRREVLAALDRLGLMRRAPPLARQLPLWQPRRVANPRALGARPTLLICDEPTIDVLQTLHAVGTTVIMATDDPLAAAWASCVVQINGGRLSTARRKQVAA